MADFRCHTIHVFFRVIGSDMFYGDDGFVQTKMHMATNIPTIERENEYAEDSRQNFAKILGVPDENVIRISRDEFLANVDEEEAE